MRSTPQPARATLAKLIIGAMLACGGHVTRAILALTPRLGWQAYHWMIEHGRFRLLDLVAALCGIVRRETRGAPRRFAVIDDTLAPRCSAKAPGAAVRFDHARKPNRLAFLRRQVFVTVGALLHRSPAWVPWGRVRPGRGPSTKPGHPSCRSRRMPLGATTSPGRSTG